jgi:hypothetical protein
MLLGCGVNGVEDDLTMESRTVISVVCKRRDCKIASVKVGRCAKWERAVLSHKTIIGWLVLSILLLVVSPSTYTQAQQPADRAVLDLSFADRGLSDQTLARSEWSAMRTFDARIFGAGQTPQTQEEIDPDIALLSQLAERWW